MDDKLFASWGKYVKNLGNVLKAMESRTTIAVGVASYQRLMPAVFLSRKSYQIYCVKDSADIDVLRDYVYIFCMEQKIPKLAAKVQSTGYLMKNYAFQGFLKSRQQESTLLFYQTTPYITKTLGELGIPWIGNDPAYFEPVIHKEGFREVLKKLKLSHLPDWTLSKEEFLKKNFDQLYKRWQKPVVCQPGDYEISGGTHFVHNQQDLQTTQNRFATHERFQNVNIVKLTPFIVGDALSMLGCVTEKGVLTSTLQLQLIDVPESLHGNPATGAFFGHDWGFKNWTAGTEADAQVTTELLGEWLYKRGYRGIFGIDFIYDVKKDNLYPIECNPRYTGTIPVISMTQLKSGAPPIDFFTLAEYMKIPVDFDFEKVNDAWKKRVNAAHVAITPLGMEKMPIDLNCGVYRYLSKTKEFEYLRPGAFLHELKNKDEFLIIDSVPRKDQPIILNVPRLFKFVFPVSIAEGSKRIKPQYGEILDAMSYGLRGEKVPERIPEPEKDEFEGVTSAQSFSENIDWTKLAADSDVSLQEVQQAEKIDEDDLE